MSSSLHWLHFKQRSSYKNVKIILLLSSVGSNSSSYYRSSYLDSSPSNSSSSYSSTFSYPSYESKYEALLSRNPDGVGKSRAGTFTADNSVDAVNWNAGTSTKYDYLSSYASNSSSQDKAPYYKTTSYASVIDTDELTKNYFEKYYNKSSNTGYSLLEREITVRWALSTRHFPHKKILQNISAHQILEPAGPSLFTLTRTETDQERLGLPSSQKLDQPGQWQGTWKCRM